MVETKISLPSLAELTFTQTTLLIHLAPLVMYMSGLLTATGTNGTALASASALTISSIMLMPINVLICASSDITSALKAMNALVLKLTM